MRHTPQSRGFSGGVAARLGLFCRDRARLAPWPLLAAALASPTMIGCVPRPVVCSEVTPAAVSSDSLAAGTNYLVIGSTVTTAADGRTHATFSPDGTTPGLLAPEAGGFILVNGGAAARRFDATGGLVAAIGYGLPAPDGSLASSAAALLGGDRLLIADAGAVRLYDAGWSTLWEHALGAASITAAASDGAGGAWVVGTFAGDDFPPWVTSGTPPQSGPYGPFFVEPNTPLQTPGSDPSDPFVLHLDGAGVEIGGGAWVTPVSFTQAIGAADVAGQPMVVLLGLTTYGDRFVAALDGGGNLLWSQPADFTARLAGDESGRVFQLSEVEGTVVVDRLDTATGKSTAQIFTGVQIAAREHAVWTTAPDASGFVIAGHLTEDDAQPCTPDDFLLQVDAGSMTVTSLPLGPKELL